MKITIRDVAAAAGVSPASVSLVLNNKPSRIPELTRQRILDAADHLGYLPGSSRKSSSPLPRSHIIGIILPEISTSESGAYLEGIERYAGIYGYRIICCNLGSSSSKCVSYIEFLWNLGVDGIIMLPPNDMNEMENNRKLGDALHRSGRPFVLLSRAIDRVFTDFVTSDFKAGAYAATEHLILSGHERIGLLSGPPEIYNTRKKLEGYKEAMIFYGFSIDSGMIYIGDCSIESGMRGAKFFIEREATAVISMDDRMAYGVYRYANEHQLRVGEDLSLISFNNAPICDILTPPLTSVSEEYELMGRKACERLIIRISGDDPDGPKNSYFVPSLVERHSVKKIGDGFSGKNQS